MSETVERPDRADDLSLAIWSELPKEARTDDVLHRIASRLRAAPEVAVPVGFEAAIDALDYLIEAALESSKSAIDGAHVEVAAAQVRAALRSPRIEKAEPEESR